MMNFLLNLNLGIYFGLFSGGVSWLLVSGTLFHGMWITAHLFGIFWNQGRHGVDHPPPPNPVGQKMA